MTTNLFAYGTLMWEDIMQTVTGFRAAGLPARLRDYHRYAVRGEDYPGIVAQKGLVVMQGKILHRIEDGQEVELNPGDVITLPPGLPHNARNVSKDDAVLFIAFSSAHRETKDA